ncbi:hypothetical protein [Phenylobacterium sp.]|jgi:hypothetical protein|uniref:hypothetical protein n=1 Tax=Phenylobacterium sp. TaxID=1871053 RepID=UPI0037849EB9
MVRTDDQRARQIAQNLVEMLSSYEEEIIALEQQAPDLAALRRAVGMAIAEACYLISDGAPH